jgi:3-oxoacyl-[acyl-carrier protein] reductase
MREQGGGRIVNVVGMAARNPAPTYMTGGAANAALINFTKALADLGAPSNILVTAVSPGPVQTERWDNLQRQQAEAAGQDLQSYIKEQSRGLPLGRIALPEEVADLVCFLASARASFLTGIAITLDGGISRGVYL